MSDTFADKAQAEAPSYFFMPDDGATFTCTICKRQLPHDQIIRPFTPDKKPHYPICLECVDEDWLSKAKNLGTYKDLD